MSAISVPSFTGKTSLYAQDVDAAFKVITDALSGGLDDTNLDAAAGLGPNQLVESSSLFSVSLSLNNLALAATAKVTAEIMMMEDSILVGWRLGRLKIAAGGTAAVCQLQLWEAIKPGCSSESWLFTQAFDDGVDSDGKANDPGGQQFGLDYRGLHGTGGVGGIAKIRKGASLGYGLSVSSGGTQVQFVTAHLLFKRLHVKG